MCSKGPLEPSDLLVADRQHTTTGHRCSPLEGRCGKNTMLGTPSKFFPQ